MLTLDNCLHRTLVSPDIYPFTHLISEDLPYTGWTVYRKGILFLLAGAFMYVHACWSGILHMVIQCRLIKGVVW